MSSSEPVLVLGAGGHACVVADALLAAGVDVIGFTDRDPARHGRRLLGRPVLGGDEHLRLLAADTVLLANGLGGIGQPAIDVRRRELQQRLQAEGWRFATVLHPRATVSPFAHIGPGAQLMAGCVVQPGAVVGEGCIVNTCAVVEHDVQLGSWTHVAPRAVVCGAAQVGAAAHIGAGATVRQGVHLGDGVIVGAGAVVLGNHPAESVLVGVPARALERGS
jgi:sugar O-acyltransferase (sialic acid O-acetyltransferase NeuD family)